MSVLNTKHMSSLNNCNEQFWCGKLFHYTELRSLSYFLLIKKVKFCDFVKNKKNDLLGNFIYLSEVVKNVKRRYHHEIHNTTLNHNSHTLAHLKKRMNNNTDMMGKQGVVRSIQCLKRILRTISHIKNISKSKAGKQTTYIGKQR